MNPVDYARHTKLCLYTVHPGTQQAVTNSNNAIRKGKFNKINKWIHLLIQMSRIMYTYIHTHTSQMDYPHSTIVHQSFESNVRSKENGFCSLRTCHCAVGSGTSRAIGLHHQRGCGHSAVSHDQPAEGVHSVDGFASSHSRAVAWKKAMGGRRKPQASFKNYT